MILLQLTVSEKDQFCFGSCVYDKDVFMKRGIITLVFLNIKKSLVSANVFNLFLIPSQWWRVIISTEQRSPEFLAEQEGTLIVSVLGVALVF